MSNDRRDPMYGAPIIQGTFHCDPEAEEHCITCSDEALHARVLRVDQEAGLALVTIKDTSEEVDITLVESIAPDDIVLVHGGVAIAHVDEASDE
jgi:hydrogenase maturation factor